MIADEVSEARFQPPRNRRRCAYAIVPAGRGVSYNDAAIGVRGDHRRLHDVEAALLGVAKPPRS